MLRTFREIGSVAGVIVLAVGCGQKANRTAATSVPPAVASATTGTGHQLFKQHCAKCHAVGTQEGGPRKGKGKGPNLSYVAADPDHTADWLAAHVRDPKVHSPNSKMPAFEGKLQPAEVQALVEYMATLR